MLRAQEVNLVLENTPQRAPRRIQTVRDERKSNR